MPYSLNAMSVRWIPTSLAGILISTAPLIMLAMARRPDTLALGSEAVLGLLRTAVSRLGMSYLIKPASAAHTATITYINPVIATAPACSCCTSSSAGPDPSVLPSFC